MSDIRFQTTPVNDELFLQRTLDERGRQDAKWGIQKHPLEKWLAILVEEVGEVAKAILEEGATAHTSCGKVSINVELIQIAAVCIAIAGSEPVPEDVE